MIIFSFLGEPMDKPVCHMELRYLPSSEVRNCNDAHLPGLSFYFPRRILSYLLYQEDQGET
jgi:hypothetical protein